MRRLLYAVLLGFVVSACDGCGRTPGAATSASSTPGSSWFFWGETPVIVEVTYAPEELGDAYLFPLKPVVQFGCVGFPHDVEDALEADLQGDDDEKRLAALDKLVEVSAPSSVPLQYAAYLDLKEDLSEHTSLQGAAQAFNREWIASVVLQAPPEDRYSSGSYEFFWCIRAAGVRRMRELLPRLLELSTASNLDTTLAAEKSIEDFDGKEGEDALLQVVSMWRIDAADRAARAMMVRNPARLLREIEMMPPPAERFYYSNILARCGSVKCVSYFCELIEEDGVADLEMFKHIARLGTAFDRERIVSLPKHVRTDYREYVQKCVDEFLKRIDAPVDESKNETPES